MEVVKSPKPKLQAALRAVRRQYSDSIAQSIVTEPSKSYLTISREHGVSEQFVVDVAKMRHIGRNAPKDEEANNG
jgi:hypothetical protein